MAKPLPLKSGAYSSESAIANAQRSINLIAEVNPENTEPEMPVTHYPRPGNLRLANPPAFGRGRCLYQSTQGIALNNGDPLGDLYAVIDQSVFFIDRDWTFTRIGAISNPGNTPVSMSDNGTSILIVDGTTNGYQIDIASRVMTQLGDPNFVGADRADFLDSFIILNKPNTNEWYSTLSDELVFNALYVGVKTAWPDKIIAVVAIEREALILGPDKSEIWFNAGAVPFPFQILPNIIIEQGCSAKYSVAKMDTNVYWLSRSPEGSGMAMKMNSQNVATRISTHAIENEWKKYPRIDDAIGAVYQLNGHSYYKITFPTADKTWGYDEATQQWHEDNWIDTNGVLHRARNGFCAFAYGKNVALDWATGQLYQIDTNTFVDQSGNSDLLPSQPIVWIRSFPHIVNELKRISHSAFTADVATGTSVGTGEGGQLLSPWSDGFSSGFGPLTQVEAPYLAMRYSKNGGYKFSNNRIKRLVSSGNYRSLMRYRSMGIARDMVYELSSTAEMIGALNGAYVDPLVGTS
jgi:hypothetical protein